MSLTSYRAAPSRVIPVERVKSPVLIAGRLRRRGLLPPARGGVTLRIGCFELWPALRRPGGDLLSHVLRRSTIGAESFHGRVRDGIGCLPLAMTTRSSQCRLGCRSKRIDG